MASFLSLLPLILNILSFALKWYGASDDVIQKYEALVTSTADSGLITVTTKDKILSQRAQILAEETAAKNPPTPPKS